MLIQNNNNRPAMITVRISNNTNVYLNKVPTFSEPPEAPFLGSCFGGRCTDGGVGKGFSRFGVYFGHHFSSAVNFRLEFVS